jgi:3-hydroxyacyl-[acyl-carrier-protein] dehydratase
MMTLTSNQIQELIPHRYPFLLVDRMIDIIPGVSGIGEKCVSANEPHFTGHFPDMHIMPGVLIIEALAQVGAVVILASDEHKGKTAFFAGIKDAKFRKKVIPGDRIKLVVEITRVKTKYGVGLGKAYVDDELACEAEFSFVIVS